MPKVSVIIPFYNVEGYIEQCLNSVVNQTLKDIEILLVNDASDDKSVSIVNKFAQEDSRIRIINLPERKGQGYARNRAMEVALGEYIGFVDSDDFVKPEMFEKLYNTAKSSNLDIAMCQAVEYDDVTGRYIDSDYYSLEPLSIFEDKIFEPKDTKEYVFDINVALWNKIYRNEYLKKTGEKFPEGFIYEDLPFFFGTYLPAKKIQIVWEKLYVYRVRAKNSTMQQVNKKVLDRLPMVSLTYEKMKKTSYLSGMKQRFQAWVIDDLFHRYTVLKDYCQKEYFFMMKKIFQGLEIEDIQDDYWKKVYHFEGYLLVINNTFEEFNQQVFNKYLDIHKMEIRLRSQIMDRDELQKNYAYTTTIFEQLRDSLNALKNDVSKKYNANLEVSLKKIINTSISDVIMQTDTKISGVYSELTKNYDYINAQTDTKISGVYSELTKNYDYTNKQVKDLNDNISSQIEEKIAWQNTQTDAKISGVYSEISKNYDYTNKLNEDTKDSISKIYSEITKNYEYTNKLSDEAKEKVVESDKLTDEKISKVYEEIENSYKRSEEFSHSRYKDVYGDVKDLTFVVHDEQMIKDAIIQELREQLRITNERLENLEKKLSK